LRVLIVSDYAYSGGGVETFIREFIEFASSQAECQLLTWRPTALVPAWFDGRIVVDCGDVRDAWEAMDSAHVLFVHTSWNVRLLAGLALAYQRQSPKPTLTVVHTSAHSRPSSASVAAQESWLAELVARSTATVGVSAAVTERLRSLSLPLDGRPRLLTIENGARLEIESPRVRRSQRQVAFIGRAMPNKGFGLFVRLAQDLRSSPLTFVANTVVPHDDDCDQISLSWLLPDRELLAFFEAADLLVAPYLCADGLPLAILDAVNCGVPILGFDSPGVGDLLRRHGLMVIPPTYEALLDAVEAWHAGRLAIPAAAPGSVRSLDECLDDYLRLLRDVGSGSP